MEEGGCRNQFDALAMGTKGPSAINTVTKTARALILPVAERLCIGSGVKDRPFAHKPTSRSPLTLLREIESAGSP